MLRFICELLFNTQLCFSCLSIFQTGFGKSSLVLKIDIVPFYAATGIRTDRAQTGFCYLADNGTYEPSVIFQF